MKSEDKGFIALVLFAAFVIVGTDWKSNESAPDNEPPIVCGYGF